MEILNLSHSTPSGNKVFNIFIKAPLDFLKLVKSSFETSAVTKKGVVNVCFQTVTIFKTLHLHIWCSKFSVKYEYFSRVWIFW